MQFFHLFRLMPPSQYRGMPMFVAAIIIHSFCGYVLNAQSVRYRDEVFTSLSRNTSVTYGSATGINNQPVTLQFEMFQPTNDTETKRPLLIMVHGGGFTTGSRYDDRILLVCSTFARRGFVTISPSYRLGLESNSTTSFFEAVLRGSQDIKALVRFCKYYSTQLGIDTSLIFVGGGSAGGYIALATAYLDKQSEYAAGTNISRWGQPEGTSNTITQRTSRIRGVVNLYGALFDTQWMEPGNVPVASCHGTNDQTVPHTANSYGMYSTPAIGSRAQSVGIPHEELLITGMWHGPAVTETAYWTQMVNFTRDFLYPIVSESINAAVPAVPTLVFPADNATQITIPTALRWNRAANAVSYTLQVSTQPSFTTTIVQQTLNDTVMNVTGLNYGTSYYWRVKSQGQQNRESSWSAVRIFSTIPPPPPTPLLVLPNDNSINNSITPRLIWRRSAQATQYQVQISTTAAFTSSIVDQTSTDSTIQVSGLQYGTQYYWRVRASHQYSASAWSAPRSFTTLYQVPSTPILASPMNNATGTSISPRLVWKRATSAIRYAVQVSTVATFATLVAEQSTTDTTLSIGGLAEQTKYYWRVRALGNGNTASSWATPFAFVTRVPLPQRDTCAMGIGMNLSLHTHYNYEQPFADVMKSASAWLTSNARWVSGGVNAWDTRLASSLSYDSNGYVISAIPFWRNGVEDSQIVKALIHRDIEGTYQSGDYVCFYEGDGRISFSFDAVVTGRSAGRVTLRVANPTNAGILMTIERNNPQNPLHNIRLVHISRVTSYRTNPFTEEFINKLRPFPVLRFMQWAKTNDNPATSWDERRPTTFYTQASNAHTGGVSWEYMFQLCNVTRKDGWICLPHNADSAYIASLAALARRELDTTLRLYLEYSNEVWNGIFPQRNWVEQNAPASLNSPQKYAYCFERAFRIFMREWTGDERRIIRVAATQLDNPWLIRQMLTYVPNGTIDAISPGGYLHLTNAAYQVLAQKGAAATADDVFADSRTYMNTPMTGGKARMREHAQTAAQYNVKLVLYEAGQHFTSSPFGSSQPYLPAIYAAQRDNRMYDLYREWITFCRDSARVDLFCAYSFVRRIESQYGSWGSMNNLYANPATQPKYRALQQSSCFISPPSDYPMDTAIRTSAADDESAADTHGTVFAYPNPAQGLLTIKLHDISAATVYTSLGVACMNILSPAPLTTLDISSLPNGHYTLMVQNSQGIMYRQSLIIMR